MPAATWRTRWTRTPRLAAAHLKSRHVSCTPHCHRPTAALEMHEWQSEQEACLSASRRQLDACHRAKSGLCSQSNDSFGVGTAAEPIWPCDTSCLGPRPTPARSLAAAIVHHSQYSPCTASARSGARSPRIPHARRPPRTAPHRARVPQASEAVSTSTRLPCLARDEMVCDLVRSTSLSLYQSLVPAWLLDVSVLRGPRTVGRICCCCRADGGVGGESNCPVNTFEMQCYQRK